MQSACAASVVRLIFLSVPMTEEKLKHFKAEQRAYSRFALAFIVIGMVNFALSLTFPFSLALFFFMGVFSLLSAIASGQRANWYGSWIHSLEHRIRMGK